MHIKVSKLLTALSVALNVVVLFFVIAASQAKTKNVSFYSDGFPIATACVIALPQNAEAVFNPPSISLAIGQSASIQFSLVKDGSQLNLAPEPLYDHGIIGVEKTGFGLLITALSSGDTVLQTFGQDGIRDLVLLTVSGGR